ncbi:Threonine efflux protein [Roseovarius albus]|uniref:Threonine efflux protein n=1 Tax=Roseovarius albus TaxID=1247867 RepID=A0A1X6ZMA6_9RHOB|nr:LysE family translocator [Roseovarius albus]SLN53568.1 Threonine efflux protein [Roseovarius albus]
MADFALFLPGFIAAYAILLVGASSPGPAVAMLLGIATSQGRGPALVGAAGIACGSIVINVATLLGIGLIVSQMAWFMGVMRLVGAAYLMWLAYNAFKKAAQPPVIKASDVQVKRLPRIFMAGFMLQVSNPKAIVFWLAIASIGATEGGGSVIVALFVTGAFLISFACHGAWALLLSSRPIRTAYQSARRWIEAGLGAFFGFAAYKLATTEL